MSKASDLHYTVSRQWELQLIGLNYQTFHKNTLICKTPPERYQFTQQVKQGAHLNAEISTIRYRLVHYCIEIDERSVTKAIAIYAEDVGEWPEHCERGIVTQEKKNEPSATSL